MATAQTDDGATTQTDLADQPYGDLMNVARSANAQFEDVDFDTDAPKKAKLVDELADGGVEFDGDTYTLDGEEVDRLESQYDPEQRSDGSSGPSDKTVLYCLTRAETTADRVEEIREALDEAGYELREAGNGDKFSIVLPAENDPSQAHLFEEDDDDDADEAEEAEESDESEEESEADEEASEGDEEPDEPPEADESEDEDSDDDDWEDDGKLSPSDVRDHWVDNKSYDELYGMAQTHDVDGRSDMNKEELVEALISDHPNIADE